MIDLVKEAKRDHDLDRIEGNSQYHTRLQKRMKKSNIQNKDDINWEKDPEDYTRHI